MIIEVKIENEIKSFLTLEDAHSYAEKNEGTIIINGTEVLTFKPDFNPDN